MVSFVNLSASVRVSHCLILRVMRGCSPSEINLAILAGVPTAIDTLVICR
jgi:hypothetical protein